MHDLLRCNGSVLMVELHFKTNRVTQHPRQRRRLDTPDYGPYLEASDRIRTRLERSVIQEIRLALDKNSVAAM